jgi:alpha-L-rhamnosidase
MVSKGATTMWERWNGDVGDVAMNSYNHYAFGAVVGFMYRRLGGIAPAAPGFRVIDVAPVYHPRIGRVRADYDSVLGRISTDVDGDGSGVRRLALTVPPNATARVTLPARAWRQGRRPLEGRADLKLARDRAVLRLEVGSGDYLFEA